MKNFAFRWLFSTNHKDIGTLYFFFGAFSGIIGTLFSVIMRMELVSPGDPILNGNFQFYNDIIPAFCWFIFGLCTVLSITYMFKDLEKIIDLEIFFNLIVKDPIIHLLVIVSLLLLVLLKCCFTIKKISFYSLFGLIFLIAFIFFRIMLSKFLKKSGVWKFYLYIIIIQFQAVIASIFPFYFTTSFFLSSFYLLIFLKVSEYFPSDAKQISYHLETDFFMFQHLSTINGALFQAYIIASVLGALYDLKFLGHLILVSLITSNILEFILTVGIINFCNVKSAYPFYSTCLTCLKLTIPTGFALALNSTLGVWEPINHPFRDGMQRTLLGYTAKSKCSLLAAHAHSLIVGGAVPLEIGTDHVDEKLARSAVETKIRSVGSQAVYGKWLGESVPDTKTSEIKKSTDKV